MILHSGQAKHKIRGQVGTAAWEFILIITGVTEGKILTDAAKDLLKKMEDQEIRRTWEKSVKKAAANFDQHVCWFNHEKNRPSIFGIDHILGDYLDALAVQQTQIDGKMVLEWTLSETIQKLPFHGHCNRCGEEQPIWRDCSFCETMYRAGFTKDHGPYGRVGLMMKPMDVRAQINGSDDEPVGAIDGELVGPIPRPNTPQEEEGENAAEKVHLSISQ
ncbi:hypothetical protein QAD02_018018 [Eretmocerus hayati]|uniref:Uncharacterized protein n=1 Tax=Eretmocerus hayati TaxID=131215 RepID=A0ACC2PHE2_9HYME|nr:hypothetical protein QAD02_018018 [Eretmocerus hayati]